MNRAFMITATLLLPLCASAGAPAQQNCTPIKFGQGQSSAIVKGIARNENPFACYTLTTGRGRTATVSILKVSMR